MGRSVLTAEMLDELREGAASAALREDMEQLRRNRKALERSRPMSPDEVLRFLTSFSQLAPPVSDRRYRRMAEEMMLL